jgi:hypothetical protein
VTDTERIRRAGILCCHCLRNIAFHRSWNKAGKPLANHQFWINANGNFLDIAVLEWCKLFSDIRGKYHYSKLLTNPSTFITGAHKTLELTAHEFDAHVKSMRTYRDKFIAHLDELNTMNIPNLRLAKKSTKLLYE